MTPTDNIGTFTLTNGSLTITDSDGIRVLSMEWVSGTVTYSGVLPIGGNASTALTLVEDDPITIGFDFPIDGFTITATAGSVKLIYGR
mgnify:CR=1 FL=1